MTRLLVTGAGGLLGGWVRRAAPSGTLAWMGSADVPLTDEARVASAFREARPGVVLHLAAMARVDACERDPAMAQRINAGAPALLARLCAERGAHLVVVSTDMVFDGERAPYRECDGPSAVSAYGRTKAEGERFGGTVARLSLLAGGFFDEQARRLRAGEPITLYEDEWRTPLDLPTAAAALLELAQARPGGVWHLAGPERLSRWQMGEALARAVGAPAS
ncbi:MAG: sugar nucleotide-binding protein, partial [Gemmataceae bacterium]|nr:sugar nucleotide-binding protein [Gemmataceae bacterium]